MLCNVWNLLETGPVKALALMWEVPIEISGDYKPSLVSDLLCAIPSASSEIAWPEEVCKIYRDAAVELGWAFAYTNALGDGFTTWDALRIWPMRISVDYMNLLGTWHPSALILLAHYCILLRKVERHWYFEGRASGLFSTIFHRLDTRWHEYIERPLEEIELVR